MLYIIYYIHWIESRLIFLYKLNKFRIPFYYTYFMVDYWSTLSWFNNSSIYCIKTTRLWNITINNDFAVTIYVRHRNDRNEKEERTKMKQETTYIHIHVTLIIRISWFTNDSSITANVSTVSSNTFPHPHGPEGLVSSPLPSPTSRNEYTVLTSSYPGRTCPAQRTTPASLGASAVLCDPGPVRRLIGINEPMRQLPRPNRIERRGESRNPGGARDQPILDRAHIFLPNTFLPWNRRWRRRCSKRDFRGLFSSGLIIVWKRE